MDFFFTFLHTGMSSYILLNCKIIKRSLTSMRLIGAGIVFGVVFGVSISLAIVDASTFDTSVNIIFFFLIILLIEV